MIPISILDNDLYKFSMQYAVIKKFPKALVKYQFFNRNNTKFPEGFGEELKRRVSEMKGLSLTKEEKTEFQNKVYYFDGPYFDFLSSYRFNPDEVKITQIDGFLSIFVEGFYYKTILWEIPLLYMTSQLYYEMTNKKPTKNLDEINRKKAELLIKHSIFVSEFGARRRYSFDNQDKFLSDMIKYEAKKFITGTSNVFFAIKHCLNCIGTQAHEWYSFNGAKYGYYLANVMGMENWVSVYNGNLGIALTDTFTTDVFLQSFDTLFSKLFDGVRQDSGSPFIWTDKIVDHYNKIGIDSKSKVGIYSDGLNLKKAIEIQKYCKGKIKPRFGIGTSFTNDVGVEPLNIVIKLVEAKPYGFNNWVKCIKLSDDIGKNTGDKDTINLAKKILNLD